MITPATPTEGPKAAPGWYPTDPGFQHWWDGSQWVGGPVPVPEAAAPSTEHTPVQGVPPKTDAPTYTPTFVTNTDGERELRQPDPYGERTAWHTAAWVGVFVFSPLAIVGGLIDNHQSKAKGLPPRYGPIIIGSILLAAGLVLAAIVVWPALSSSAACRDLGDQVVALSQEPGKGPVIDSLGPATELKQDSTGLVTCQAPVSYVDGSTAQLRYNEIGGGYVYWKPVG